MLGPTLNTEKIHKSIPNLGRNGMCPVETVHLDKVFQCNACQSHWAHTPGRTHSRLTILEREESREKKQGSENRQVCGGVYGFEKANGISWLSTPSLCLVFFSNPQFVSRRRFFSLFFFFLQIYFKVFFGSRRCQVGRGLVRTGAKKLQQSQENIWSLFRILFCD